MTLKKFKISGAKKAQSVIEYTLLIAISIVALIAASNFVVKFKDSAFEKHFKTAAWYIGGITP